MISKFLQRVLLLMFIVGGFSMAEPARAETLFDLLFGNFEDPQPRRHHRKQREQVDQNEVQVPRRKKQTAIRQSPKRSSSYQGAAVVEYDSDERPGTIIIETSERALYRVLGRGKAKRYGVAVGKEGFQWSGVARVGMKRVNPTWTPPPEMIERSPQYEKWADGMPGGIPENPLGTRAMYLYDGGDTGFRIHGTIHPESIGRAASSGCIRMLNEEVEDLYDDTPVGTKVIVN